MFKTIFTLIGTTMIAGLLSSAAWAAPVTLNEAQLDGVAAGGVAKVDGFVCPVISTDAVLHAKNGGPLGIKGYYTVGGPDVRIPLHATNGDGAGSPAGPFSKPGDTDYTAIWSR